MDLTQTRARKLDNPQYLSKISTRLDKTLRKKGKSPTAQPKSPVVDYEKKYALYTSKKE